MTYSEYDSEWVLYSPGVIPVTVLNRLQKWLCEENPSISAICDSSIPPEIRLLAASILRSRI